MAKKTIRTIPQDRTPIAEQDPRTRVGNFDEVFADRLDLARASGVQVFARRCSVSTSKVALGPSVPVV